MRTHELLIADCYRAAGLAWHHNVVHASTPATALLIATFGAAQYCRSWTDPTLDPSEDPLDLSAAYAISDAVDDMPIDAIGADSVDEDDGLDSAILVPEPIKLLDNALQDELMSVCVDLDDWGGNLGDPKSPLLGELHKIEMETRAEAIYRSCLGENEFRALQRGLACVGLTTPQAPTARMGVLSSDTYLLWDSRFRGLLLSTYFSWWAFPWFAVVHADADGRWHDSST